MKPENILHQERYDDLFAFRQCQVFGRMFRDAVLYVLGGTPGLNQHGKRYIVPRLLTVRHQPCSDLCMFANIPALGCGVAFFLLHHRGGGSTRLSQRLQ